jgi:hypothetical protein
MVVKTSTPKKGKLQKGSAGKGRPSSYTDEIAIEICAGLAEGKSLRSVLKSKNMPSMSMVFRWLAADEHKAFREQYARAKVEAADALADDIQDITDKVLKRTYDPASARVAIDGKKWIASKLKPKVYGDKLDLTGDQTITHKFKDLDDEQLDAAIAGIKDTVA